METPPNELTDNEMDREAADHGIPVREVSFDENFHRYEDKPRVSNQQEREREDVEIAVFEAGTPEAAIHNERKRRLGINDLVDSSSKLRRRTNYISSTQNKSMQNSRERGRYTRSPLRAHSPARSKSSKSRKSKSGKSKSPYRASNSPKRRYSYFGSSLYQRSRKLPGKRYESATKKSRQVLERPKSERKRSSPKLKKPRIPSERKKQDVKRYNVEDLMRSRITNASREGKTTMHTTSQMYDQRAESPNNETGLMRCSIEGASKGKLFELSPQRKTPKPKKKTVKKKVKRSAVRKKSGLRKASPKRQGSARPTREKKLIMSPSRTVVVYYYNKTGRQIVKQETIHEYRERVAKASNIAKLFGPAPLKK